MPKTVETYRTTKALRDLVRRAAEEKAKAVIEAAARATRSGGR